MQLTILFNDPYWIGLVELERESCLYAATYLFGAEPGDAEVYQFVLRNLVGLLSHMTIGLPVQDRGQPHVNPKRKQREARRQVMQRGMSTRAQEAVKQQFEQNKQDRVQVTRAQRDIQRDHKRDVAREKAKAKHRGR